MNNCKCIDLEKKSARKLIQGFCVDLYLKRTGNDKYYITADNEAGYKEITMSDDYMSDFYTNPCENKCNLQIGEYILVKNVEGEIVDRLCWNGEYYRHLDYKSFNSRWFGEVKPIKGDPYQ